MDINALKEQVVQELNAAAGESKEVHTLAADVVIDALFRVGYRIVPAIVKMEITYIHNFESAVLRWCANDKIEEGDINGPSVIQSLTSDGWVIIPPQ
jgi:hypothetical protein